MNNVCVFGRIHTRIGPEGTHKITSILMIKYELNIYIKMLRYEWKLNNN